MLKRILLEIKNEDRKNPYTDKELSEILNINRADIVRIRKENGILNSRERRKEILLNDIKEIIDNNSGITERKLTENLFELGYNISRSAVAKIIKDEGLRTGKKEENPVFDNDKIVKEEKNYKISGEDIKIEKILKVSNKDKEESGFESLIGANGSLKEKINLAKSAIIYPPNGLHTMLYGESGVGKSELANCMYKYAVRKGIKKEGSPFIVFNCADYAENPNLLIAQLFGVVKGAYTGAKEDKVGLVELADGGILFLDEIHRLPPSGQEILFSLIDRGEFRRLGESSNKRKVNVLIISATTENPDSILLNTFRRRIPMFITIPNIDSRPKSERYDIILKFFEREAKRVNKSIIVTKEVLYAFMVYKCKANIGQLKSDIQVSCARAFGKLSNESDNLIIDIDILKNSIKESIAESLNKKEYICEDIHLDDVYIDVDDISENSGDIISGNNANEIYHYAEKELKLLESKNYSEEEIKNIFYEKLDRKFNQIKRNNIIADRKRKYSMGVNLNNETIEIMNKVSVFLRSQYKHISNGLYLALAIHIEHAINRLKKGKKIVNPGIDKIKNSLNEEFEIAEYIVRIIENIAGVSVPLDEKGYIAYYIYKFCFNEETAENSVKVIIATHGRVGVEMSKVVNNILGINCTYGIEVSIDASPMDGIESALNDIESFGFKRDILLLIDMGSLVMLGEKIEERIGVRCKVINRVDTILAMEAGKAAVLEGKGLDTIVSDLRRNKDYSIINNTPYRNKKSKDKRNIIITLCLSGKGTALTLKEIIEKRIPDYIKDEVSVYNLGIISENELDLEIKKLEEKYNIVAICGTIDVGYNNIPFISYNEVLKGDCAEKIVKLIESEKTLVNKKKKEKGIKNLIHENLILENIEGISKEYIIDTLVSKLEEGGFVNSKYILSVYKREAMGGVVMSQKVAIPHGLPENVIKPAIAIARLSKPIIWDNEFMVETVVLIAIKENNKDEIRDLLLRLSEPKFVDKLSNIHDKDEIISMFS